VRTSRVPRPVDIAQRSVIDYLPGGERIALLRYQGPEQRSREAAHAKGRVQHGGVSLRVDSDATPTVSVSLSPVDETDAPVFHGVSTGVRH